MIFRRLLRGWAGGKAPSPAALASRVRSKRYESARALAESFGCPIFEPTWWPEDVRSVSYRLERSRSGVVYRIGSTRSDGTPICVIGSSDHYGNLPKGNWSQPPELEAMQGLVRTNGNWVHGVVHARQQTIHLVGYVSEAELVRAVRSFHRVSNKEET